MPSVRSHIFVGFIGLGSVSCHWHEHEIHRHGDIRAFGEVYDVRREPAPGVEVRLIKHWPLQGTEPVEPPPSVLFADDPEAPEGADYRVELIAVATTDDDGGFGIGLDAETIRDPRFEPDSQGRIIVANTVIVVRDPSAPQTGVYSYSWRFRSRYRRHFELLTLTDLDASVSFARTRDDDAVDFDFGRVAQRIRASDANIVDYQLLVGPAGATSSVAATCNDLDGELTGCGMTDGANDRLRLSLPATALRASVGAEPTPFEASLVADGPLFRILASFTIPADPTWGGAFAVEPDPTVPAPGAPTEPASLDFPAVWAVGSSVAVDLTETAARDGDPVTRVDVSNDDVEALYVFAGDARLTEVSLLNTVVDDAENCMTIQTSPTPYASLEAAIGGVDWVGSVRLCGSTGAPDEVSFVQLLAPSQPEGQRAAWIRITAAPGETIRFLSIGEVSALGFSGAP